MFPTDVNQFPRSISQNTITRASRLDCTRSETELPVRLNGACGFLESSLHLQLGDHSVFGLFALMRVHPFRDTEYCLNSVIWHLCHRIGLFLQIRREQCIASRKKYIGPMVAQLSWLTVLRITAVACKLQGTRLQAELPSGLNGAVRVFSGYSSARS